MIELFPSEWMPAVGTVLYSAPDNLAAAAPDLLEALEKLGFQAKGVRGEMASLLKIPKPAIAHVIIKEVLQHYVVIYAATEKHIEVMDPGTGQMHKYTHEDFRKIRTGVLESFCRVVRGQRSNLHRCPAVGCP